jgi:Flp pilus assembly protein TadG
MHARAIATNLPGRLRPGHVASVRLGEAGQAMVEFVVILPLVVLLFGVAFTGWQGMQSSIRLTTAARAAAIVAAHDLKSGGNALDDATSAVNQEEGVTNVYQDTASNADNYVSMSVATDTLNSAGLTIDVVKISITHIVLPLVPGVWKLSVTSSATARYS